MSGDLSYMAEVMSSRASFYRLLARLYFKPLATEDIEQLAAMDFVGQAKAQEEGGELARGLNDMGRGLRRRHTGTRTLLATDFTMCFDGIRMAQGKPATPYASVFLSDDGLLYREPRNAVYRLYLEQGVHVKAGIDLPEDHLSFELEYLAILAERAQAAFATGDAGCARQALENSRAFIHEHVETWLPLFVARANEILETRFYRGVVEATLGYVSLDGQTVLEALDVCREVA